MRKPRDFGRTARHGNRPQRGVLSLIFHHKAAGREHFPDDIENSGVRHEHGLALIHEYVGLHDLLGIIREQYGSLRLIGTVQNGDCPARICGRPTGLAKKVEQTSVSENWIDARTRHFTQDLRATAVFNYEQRYVWVFYVVLGPQSLFNFCLSIFKAQTPYVNRI